MAEKGIRCTKRVSEIKAPIREISTKARELKEKGMKIHPLNIGDPNKFDFEVPGHIRTALDEGSEAGWYSDSEGDPELLKAISEWINGKYGTHLKPTDVVVTTGISEGVSWLMDLFLEQKPRVDAKRWYGGAVNSILEIMAPEDEVLLPGPCFPQYVDAAKLRGGKPVFYKCDEENNWQPDMADVRSKISKRTKFMLLINPNNPTGAVYDRKTVQEFVDIAGEHGIPVVSDEIYDQLIFSGKEHTSALSVDTKVPIIYLNGFSKSYLIPGYRAGYVAFHDPAGKLTKGIPSDEQIPEATKKLARIRLSMSTPVMKAAIAAYKGPQDHIVELNRKLKERGEFAYKRLNEIEGISAKKPEGAFYIFFNVSELTGEGKPWKDDRDFCLDVLEHTGVAFVPGSGFGKYGEGHVRSVILPSVKEQGAAFDKLEQYVTSRKTGQ